jgi:putative hydrolase of the HAD superfamily
MTNSLKAVLFDLDGTLLDRDSSLQQFVTKQYDKFFNHLSHISRNKYVERFIELDCRGHVWKDLVYQSLITEFDISKLSWQKLLSDYETNFRFYCVSFPNLKETLTFLKQQEYLLGIITNGRGVFQARSIEGLGIKSYFDIILISEIEKVRKPQAEIFQRALQRLNAIAQEGVYIGDHPEVDIIGAKNAGLKTIWKRNTVWEKSNHADAIIDDLSEIASALKQFNRH